MTRTFGLQGLYMWRRGSSLASDVGWKARRRMQGVIWKWYEIIAIPPFFLVGHNHAIPALRISVKLQDPIPQSQDMHDMHANDVNGNNQLPPVSRSLTFHGWRQWYVPSMAFWPPALPLAAIVLNPGDPTNHRRVMFRIQEYSRLFPRMPFENGLFEHIEPSIVVFSQGWLGAVDPHCRQLNSTTMEVSNHGFGTWFSAGSWSYTANCESFGFWIQGTAAGTEATYLAGLPLSGQWFSTMAFLVFRRQCSLGRICWKAAGNSGKWKITI